jgi:hypothetical protein
MATINLENGELVPYYLTTKDFKISGYYPPIADSGGEKIDWLSPVESGDTLNVALRKLSYQIESVSQTGIPQVLTNYVWSPRDYDRGFTISGSWYYNTAGSERLVGRPNMSLTDSIRNIEYLFNQMPDFGHIVFKISEYERRISELEEKIE